MSPIRDMEQAGQAASMEQHTPTAPVLPSTPGFGAAQRLIESAVIAVATSTGLYLVGSVYADAYYGRMSIEVTSLDLSPPFIALQSAHVLQGLLEYPTTLLFFYLLYRMLSSRLERVRSWWYDRVQQRFGRLFLLIVNLVTVSPLVAAAAQAGLEGEVTGANSVLSEVASLMWALGVVLVIYLIWLSFGPREVLISQIREHKIIPIALVFALYLLDALVATADGAAIDAELLMAGTADQSIAIEFTMTDGVNAPLPGAELILVTARNGNYYVVERQDLPPSRRPVAYAISFDSVDSVRMQRINDADSQLEDFMFEPFASPTAG